MLVTWTWPGPDPDLWRVTQHVEGGPSTVIANEAGGNRETGALVDTDGTYSYTVVGTDSLGNVVTCAATSNLVVVDVP